MGKHYSFYKPFLLILFVLFLFTCSKNPSKPEEKTQNTESTTVNDIDGNVYKTVKIGDQLWMAENLNVTHYRNGDAIPYVPGNSVWTMLKTGAYCYYENDSSYASDYGALYNWYAVNDSRNIAPEGWHVPTDADWKQLEMYLGMSKENVDVQACLGTDEGGKLKDTGNVHWNSPNTGATNESGFTARAGGSRRNDNGSFNYLGSHAGFWSSTEANFTHAYARHLRFNYKIICRYSDFFKQSGYSVRCVRD